MVRLDDVEVSAVEEASPERSLPSAVPTILSSRSFDSPSLSVAACQSARSHKSFASRSSSTASAEGKVVEFLKERNAAAENIYTRVFDLGLRLITAGVVFAGIGTITQAFAPPHPIVHIPAVLGHWCGSVGLVIVSTVLHEDTDVDLILESRPLLRLIGCLAWAGSEVVSAWRGAPASLVPAFLGLAVGHKCVNSLFYIRLSTVAHHLLAISMLAPVFSEDVIRQVLEGDVASAVARIVGFLWIEGHWWRSRVCKKGPIAGEPGLRTRSVYTACYIYFFTKGIHLATMGTSQALNGGPLNQCIEYWLSGLASSAPPALVMSRGRAWWFGLVARKFDRDQDRAMKDAAFVAHLLDSTYMRVGEEWWRWRDHDKDWDFPEEDARHHFEKGKIVKVGKDGFTVLFPQRKLEASAVQTFPMAGRNTPIDDLLVAARVQLRCMEWEDLTSELLASGPICGASDPLLAANEFLAMSRPVREGERIDYFLSHCWHDDPGAKFNALSSIAADFHRRNGRYPTFWFDKTCIDQTNIADGLRVLPLTIMSCERFLMLCGLQYPQRLWCVWELFTIMAFFRLENAMEKIVPLVLDHLTPSQGEERGDNGTVTVEKGESDPLADMCCFEAANARCFDPNDQLRLQKVIRAVGEQHFNMRIQQLGTLCREQRVEFRKARLRSTFLRGGSWTSFASSDALHFVTSRTADLHSPASSRAATQHGTGSRPVQPVLSKPSTVSPVVSTTQSVGSPTPPMRRVVAV